MTTIIDIARLARVSTATVSRTINNPNSVMEAKRNQVLEAIEQLNYTPNAHARALVTKNSKTIGVIIPHITSIGYPTIVNNFASIMEKCGYTFILCITDADPDKELIYCDMLLKNRVDGIVFLGIRLKNAKSNDRIYEISKKLPVVIIDYLPHNNILSIRPDEEQGAFSATEYLIKLGHRQIGFIGGSQKYGSFYYRYLGYKKALKKHGIAIDHKYCITVDPYFSGGIEGANTLMNLKCRPTAIFSAADQIAVGVFYEVQCLKMKIPDDISIIGFSGTQLSGNIYPSLTTVDQFPQLLGKGAAELLISAINGEEIPNRQIIIPTRLIERNSCRIIN